MGDRKRLEAHHTSELAIGGKAKRTPALRVMQPPTDFALPADWELEPGVPSSRGACGEARPCPHLKCRYHLWLHEADARPGRRHEQGGAPASSLRPSTSTTCALDVADAGQHTFAEIGKLLGITDEGARVIMEKARAKIEALGYTLADLLSMQDA